MNGEGRGLGRSEGQLIRPDRDGTLRLKGNDMNKTPFSLTSILAANELLKH